MYGVWKNNTVACFNLSSTLFGHGKKKLFVIEGFIEKGLKVKKIHHDLLTLPTLLASHFNSCIGLGFLKMDYYF